MSRTSTKILAALAALPLIASLAACATPLLEAGAVGVSAITVARER